MTSKAIEILLSIVLAIIPIVTPCVLVWLKGKIGAEKWAQFMSVVRGVVKAAEVLGASSGWTSEAKKDWACKELARLTKMKPETLSTFIEQAVAELKLYDEELELNSSGVGRKTCGNVI